jgi:hypothetical protein
MSYNGKIDFGLLGDYDAMEDVTLVAEGIEAEIKQLLDAAKRAEKESTAPGTDSRAKAAT